MMVYIRGGGDLASGVAVRLWRAGMRVVIAEIPRPLAVRRRVSFSEAVYEGQATVEEITAVRVTEVSGVSQALGDSRLPVMVDPQAEALPLLRPHVLVDARMLKHPPEIGREAATLVIGLGPGFCAGENCHAVIETMRGHTLGRVIWQGTAQADTGRPEAVQGQRGSRVLRAPASGSLITYVDIGDRVPAGQVLLEVSGVPLAAPFDGVVRGLLRPGFEVTVEMKIGDLDPRLDPSFSGLVSDKALAVGGGVLEAILSRPDLREKLWEA